MLRTILTCIVLVPSFAFAQPDAASRVMVVLDDDIGQVPMLLRFSPNGKTLAAVLGSGEWPEGKILMWDLDSRGSVGLPWPPETAYSQITTLEFLDDTKVCLPRASQMLRDHGIRHIVEDWDLTQGVKVEVGEYEGRVFAIAMNKEHSLIAAGGRLLRPDGTQHEDRYEYDVQVWDRKNDLQQTLKGRSSFREAFVYALRFRDDGSSLLMLVGNLSKGELWECPIHAAAEPVRIDTGRSYVPTNFDRDPKSGHILVHLRSEAENWSSAVYDVDERASKQLEAADARDSMWLSSDGRLLLRSPIRNGMEEFHDLFTGKIVNRTAGKTFWPVFGGASSPDGRWYAAGCLRDDGWTVVLVPIEERK